jgi:hypothetical protein
LKLFQRNRQVNLSDESRRKAYNYGRFEFLFGAGGRFNRAKYWHTVLPS